MIDRIRSLARRLLARLEAGWQLWPLPSRRRDPVVDEVLAAADLSWSIEAYRAMRDADPVLGPLFRELGQLQPWQEAAVDAWLAGARPATATELAISARRSSKLAAHRMAIAAELAAGGHPHVLSHDGLSCPGGYCTAEQLARPAPPLDLEDLPGYVDEAWQIDQAVLGRFAAALTPGPHPGVSWSSPDASMVDDLAAATADPPWERPAVPPGTIHGKLLDDTRCCPAAEVDGAFSTVFRKIVTCRNCQVRMDAVYAAREARS